jgi:hypothetical protein
MGQFLSMSGIVGGTEDPVIDMLRDYAEEHAGTLDEADLTTEDDGCLVISEGVGGVTVLYPSDFYDWDNAAQYLSLRLSKSVFSFHIHDGDLWMYCFFANGKLIDQFNPIPDYWQKTDEAERRSWAGNASKIAKRVPGLAPEHISRYLVQWGDDVFDADERTKAYPSDHFYYGDDWQLVDFMDKLGLDFPIDDKGEPHGGTYRFDCKSDETS